VTNYFLIVEYEKTKPSRWVAHPIGFDGLCELFSGIGPERVQKVSTRQSRFGGTFYSAFAKRLK